MTPQDLAAKLGVHVTTIYNHADAMGLERTQYGRLRLLLLDDAAAAKIAESIEAGSRVKIDVDKARKMRAKGATLAKIGEKFGVSRQAVYAALKGDGE